MADDKHLDYLRRSVAELRSTRAKLTELETQIGEPIAIVGMSCRFGGGVRAPSDLWKLVSEKGDAIGAFPDDRGWDIGDLVAPDAAEQRLPVSGGGFLDAAAFDAGFFNFSPREAESTDPQHRMLLELSWEAIEDAGFRVESLQGSDTGVFIGEMHHDYPGESASGAMGSGRIAYTFGLQGPAISVDTACSSSLVALHQAMGALKLGQCDLALVGGVTAMATPELFTNLSRKGMVAPDARCKSFADAADGPGWGEGVAVIVIERLSRAEALGHRVLARIRGSAVNQDGASNGFTAPNGTAQRRLIRSALEQAGLEARDIDLVEAHGTGTRLGDPIEAHAIIDTYGQGRRPEDPVWLGSVKSNLGHTQAAAGLAGIIKVVCALRAGQIPPTMHVDTPSRHIDWDTGSVRLCEELRAWPPRGRPRRAAVSAFGLSGTNAHVIVEESQYVAEPMACADEAGSPRSSSVAWFLSGRGEASLARQAENIVRWVEHHPEASPREIADELLLRSRLSHRAVVVGDSREELIEGANALARGKPHESIIANTRREVGGVVLVFPGHGGQWSGMGADLVQASAVFAEEVAKCDRAFEPLIGWSVADAINARSVDGNSTLSVLQPVVFTLMAGMARLWEAMGVRADGVIGHSQGEVVAAYISGALSLEDAAVVSTARVAQIMRLVGTGAMAAVALSPEHVGVRLRFHPDVEIGAYNSPRWTMISGPSEAVARLCKELVTDNVDVHDLATNVASHSSAMEVVRDELIESLAGVASVPSTMRFYSTVTGSATPGELGGDYWFRNLSMPVRLTDAVANAVTDGVSTFIECSVHPQLSARIIETVEDQLPDVDICVVGSSRRHDPGIRSLVKAAARLDLLGLPIRWPSLWGKASRRLDDPFRYAFASDRYWMRVTGDSLGINAALEKEARPRSSGQERDLTDERHVVDLVREAVAQVLGHRDIEAVSPDGDIQFLGFTSLMAVELRNSLQSITGVRLPLRVMLDDPTPAAYASHISEVVRCQ